MKRGGYGRNISLKYLLENRNFELIGSMKPWRFFFSPTLSIGNPIGNGR